jgi:HAMP domain-containing protein
MKQLSTWYKNLNLSTRLIFSMNLCIFLSITIISVFATINRKNVQLRMADALVANELNQITDLLGFLQDRPINDLQDIIKSKVLYNTGFISLVSADGKVLICRYRQGENLATMSFFSRMKTNKGPIVFTDPTSGGTLYQYQTYYEPLKLFVTATLDKKEFIDKPVINTLMILIFALIFTWITFSIANYFIMRTVTTPISGLVKVVRELGRGVLPEKYEYNYKDEVGQITGSVNELIAGLKQTSIFASEIGKKNFDHVYEPLSENDVLGNALLEMRESLKVADAEERERKIEDEKRNWTTHGLAKFAEILRRNNNNIQELSYDIIRNLVEYLDINQGGMFILNDDDQNKQSLELTACYAFDRRKFLEKKIFPGEGLVGTCYLEAEPIYLTKIPQNYIRITSGLGDENPSSLLLIPLKLNEKVYGVIELASFKPFEQYKLEFVNKIGESIASTISSVRINMQTALLLQKSQQQAEEMRAQEEEMRQNMEELAATQEAMEEKERDNEQTISKLNHDLQKFMNMLKERDVDSVDSANEKPVERIDVITDPMIINEAGVFEGNELDTLPEDKNIMNFTSGDEEGIDDSSNIHDNITDNQKAWSEHIHQKGKSLKKSKKK